ncbi:aminoacyl-tRNA hydrolase [Kordiimonas aquimaris]|uniref:aminoacyl-tRNA hydrolase n=1 Tax=Kordiimonas aquimaris TaxID=707591 RepID=UPI0021CDEED3|nr:aminoacyl-tRNA hydrolase [Kordiimonas aquimaris]
MRLFVGLGNPGSKYENNRHNIGFMAVDEIVRRHNFLPGVNEGKKRWQSLTHEGRLGSEKIILIKPQTFMNESGRAVGEAMRFFKLSPADIVVFYDELDIAFGKVKAKVGGGAAGHNGIRSMIAHIGADFMRVRLGIGHPGDKARVHGHVLGDFAKAEHGALDDMINAVAAEAAYIADGDSARFLTEVARRINPQRPNGDAKAAKAKTKQSAAPAAIKKQPDGPMAAALKALKDKIKGDS